MTHVLLAVSCLLRRADGADVTGRALRAKAAGVGQRPTAVQSRHFRVPGHRHRIFRIQDQAQRNNARDDLTGVLLFNRSYFLQYLEGEREQMTRTFTVIAADDRHRQVGLLHVADITERNYPNWTMGLLDDAFPSLRAVLDEILPGGLFMPANLSSYSAM